MATRIAHISDLHFPARDSGQAAALARSIAEAAPDLLVVTGDLTRSGTKEEFRQAADFIRGLGARTLVVPGNHDIPVPGVVDRLLWPFKRFAHYFPDQPRILETADVVVLGLNTAVGIQSSWDWSLGYAVPARIAAVAELLRERRGDRLAIVAGHHSFRPHLLDPGRSRTTGGVRAFDDLAAAGMDVLLHGHLHRHSVTCVSIGERQVCEVCANTALANRERGGPAGYNVLDVSDRHWQLTTFAWHEDRYAISNADVADA